MDMQVDAQLIRNERLKRAWSQEQLAQVSGLGIRTVQRIESGGNASLETVKALAAVLELPTKTLIAAAPSLPASLPAPIIPPPSIRFSLFRPWRTFVAGGLTALITMGGVIGMQGASAEQVAMEFAVFLDAEQLSQGRLTGSAGKEAIVRIDDVLRMHLTPSITADGHILIATKFYRFEDGEYRQIAAPSIMTMDGQPAKIAIGKPDAPGEFLFEFDVTPRIE